MFTLVGSAWVTIFKVEETHVSAHMFFVKSLIFDHDPCCYLVFFILFGPVYSCSARPSEKYSLFIDFCSANEFFYAWLILVDYADVSYICKSFEPRISVANLCHAAFLQKVD